MNKRIKSLVLGASLVASMAVLGGCGLIILVMLIA